MHIIYSALFVAALAVTGAWSYQNLNWHDAFYPEPAEEQNLGATYIRSLQLAASPSTGLVLKTNGTDNYWDTDATGGGGSGVGTVATSSPETIGQLAYWGTSSGYPAKLNSAATTSLTINAPLTTSGTAGALVGGTNLTIDIDDIKAADLDLTDITLNDFTNDAGFITSAGSSNWSVFGGTGWLYPSTTIGVIVNASSTFNATTSLSALRVFGGNVSASQSVGGLINCNRSTFLGPCFVGFSSAGAGGGRMASFMNDNPAFDTQLVHASSSSLTESTLNVFGAANGKGVIKASLVGGNNDSAGISSDVTTNGGRGQAYFGKCNSGTTTPCYNALNESSVLLWSVDGFGRSSMVTASTTLLTLGNAGTNVGIFFSQDGDGALTVQGIGNANNEDFVLNLDDTADVGVYSSNTGLVAFDYPNMRLRTDGIVIDGDGTFPASSDGSILIGDGTDTGTFEVEDAPVCIGDGGCTPNALDGSLVVNYASSTALTVSGTASTSKFFADGLGTCNSGNMLTWTGGTFGCASETILTAGDGLTLTATDIDCDTASATVFGCLTAANFIAFNNKWDLASSTIPIAKGGTGLTAVGASSTVLTTNGTIMIWQSLVSYITETVRTASLIVTGAWDFGDAATLEIPNAADPTVSVTGQIAVNSTAASSSIRFYDGTAERALYPETDVAFNYSTSTATQGTTTIALAGPIRTTTYTQVSCMSTGGTAKVQLGDGTASSTIVTSQNGLSTTFTTLSSNNVFLKGEVRFIAIGTFSATTITQVSCTYGRTQVD